MDATDADGRTALWLAVRAGQAGLLGGQAGLLGALLSAGASPSREDGGGLPPLWVACAMCQRGLALQLLRAGAAAAACDGEGTPCLHVAAQRGQPGLPLVELLIEH